MQSLLFFNYSAFSGGAVLDRFKMENILERAKMKVSLKRLSLVEDEVVVEFASIPRVMWLLRAGLWNVLLCQRNGHLRA